MFALVDKAREGFAFEHHEVLTSLFPTQFHPFSPKLELLDEKLTRERQTQVSFDTFMSLTLLSCEDLC